MNAVSNGEYAAHVSPGQRFPLLLGSLALRHRRHALLPPRAYTLLFLAALPGNVLSLWVFLRRIAAASPVHVYLSHLSISNLTLALTTPFLAAYFARGSVWTRSGFLCQLVLHAITPVFHINISMTILTWVALSRFAALIQHTHASRPSGCITLLPRSFFARLTRASFASRVCATVWVAAVGATVPVTVFYSVNAAEDGCVEVCYNPAVEIGGSLSATLALLHVALFFVFYLLVLLSHMTVLRHIRRSRRGTRVTTSQSLLGRVLHNIVVIQVVLSVCLLPYHIFKPILISLAFQCDDEFLSLLFLQLKNCLRGATDPLMYYLLGKTFRHQTLRLLRCNQNSPRGREMCSVIGSDNQRSGHLQDVDTETKKEYRHLFVNIEAFTST
uniref:G protein-coupled receptor 82 n=1 Tax=Cyclopterus lumpus TaxID=8103 RepID=A0A8C2Z3L4_CYCLU